MAWLKIVVGAGVLAVLVILKVGWSLYKKRHIFEFAKNFNGFRFYPIFGNFWQLSNIGYSDFFDAVRVLARKLGLPLNFWYGHSYIHVTDDAEAIKVILNHPDSLDKASFYNIVKVIFDDCLLVYKAEDWKVRRKFFSKSFNQPLLNSYVHYFYRNSNVLVDVLHNDYEDLFSVFGHYTFDTFCDIYVGKSYNLQTDPNNRLIEELDAVQKYIGESSVVAVTFGFPLDLKGLVTNGWSTISLLNQLRKLSFSMIDFRREELQKEPVVGSQLSFLDAMISRGDLFHPSIMSKELLVFLLAATDTTGNALTFIFTLLGMHPEIQQKVYEEVITEIGRDAPIETDHLPKLKYTERVISESMRLLPPVPMVARYLNKDIQIGDKTFPKGANVIVYTLALHRNSKYWPNPKKFDPDRFLPEEIAKRPPSCYIPFSGGPRNCIGKLYAMMSMKVVVANVIRNFRISSKYRSVDEMEMRGLITMRTKDDIDCHFSPRK
ncbi:probable cytochrome P450 4d20 [Sitophilus oryzae]|uniref:Probable cytochrome P450 4d20 n=1 Tax=Sitophilus oryzae TaxID=7048 RepID=A0A6J2XWF4_SITOR|nr:probable cytochrome P450 4d20 [Sitophilus oryzae]XP_030755101.1 probable cytochrome P450 4d20 [Sitophilus oryzae]